MKYRTLFLLSDNGEVKLWGTSDNDEEKVIRYWTFLGGAGQDMEVIYGKGYRYSNGTLYPVEIDWPDE